MSACSRSRSVEQSHRTDAARRAQGEEQPREKKPAAESARRPQAPKAEKSEKRSGPDEKGPPLATAPTGLLRPGAVESIQGRLADRRYLESNAKSGRWDEETEKAVRRFQRDNGLPATGAPDDETVQKLDLKPADVFRAAPGGS